MEYGRLGVPEPAAGGPPSSRRLTPNQEYGTTKKSKLNFLLLILAAALIAAAVALVIRNRTDSGGAAPLRSRRPSEAISRACARTRYPNLCVDSLLDFSEASEKDLVHISVNMTLRRFGHALYAASEIVNLNMDPHVRSAVEACLELLDDSVDLLSRSLTSVAPGGAGSTQDVLTWLSASLTNQDTCSEGFDEVDGSVKSQMSGHLRDLSELVSNCLAIYASAAGGNDFSGIPIQNRRRLLSDREHFPAWLSRRDRVLLDMPAAAVAADVVVSKDANSTCKTIEEAIKKAPENGTRRFIIYVRAGKYDEKILKVGRKKTNLMFIGDGKGKTVISGGKSVQDNMTTFHTASFAATGNGFIARDITFENWAGPGKHQAVALRVGSDHAVIYRCNIIGYQDTLYVHSQRQFYRECDIYGTVDFIFGNAAVVFQNCSMYARKPLEFQKNTITAQNRKDPNQNTGMSIHNCRLLAQPDLMANKSAFATYLGRPWKMYSRTVFMLSYMDSHINPKGWLAWNETFALDTLYYGEYMNYGPGGAIGQRVNWTGHHLITAPQEANKFTVAQFISGSTWLPSTGVSFMAGLQT